MSATYNFRDVEAFLPRFYPGKRLLITPYGYSTTYLALAQAAVLTNVVNIAANADFLLLAVSQRAQIGAAQNLQTVTAPFVRLLITDSGSNEQYMNQAVDLINYAGSALKEKNLSYPRLISGRSTLTLQATNYAPTAETYTTLDVFLEGCLVRAYEQ